MRSIVPLVLSLLCLEVAHAQSPSQREIYDSLGRIESKLKAWPASPDDLARLLTKLASAERMLETTLGTPAVLTISDGPAYDFGASGPNGVMDHTFRVTNVGGTAATSLTGGGLSAPFTYRGGNFPGSGATCGRTLAPFAPCTIVVTFEPKQIGELTGLMTLSYFDGVDHRSVSRTLTGAGR